MTIQDAINYFKGSMAIGEDDDIRHHNEVLEFTIEALEKQDRIAQILDDCDLLETWETLDDYDLLEAWEVLKMIKEEMKKMTREKIIQGLYKGDSRAIKEAIKALEQEPCEDCISREAVKNILPRQKFVSYEAYLSCMADVDKLPSVTSKKEEWIPCSERLPKPNELVDNVRKYYLIQDEYGDMHVASYLRNGWISIDSFYTLEDDVIAWMPLPEPYKAESEG